MLARHVGLYTAGTEFQVTSWGPVAGLGSVHLGTSSLERVVMASLGVAVVTSLGCDITPFPTTPTSTATATATPGPEPSAAQRLAAFALFDAATMHAVVTTSPLAVGTDSGKVKLSNGPCALGQGSMQDSLDGGLAPTPGTFLPTGSHTYAVSYRNCAVNWWFDTFELNGVTSAAYYVADWSNITATVSAEAGRYQGPAFWSELYNVTADGSAVWTKSSHSTTYTPAIGSRLVNNSTNNVATFGGGSYSVITAVTTGGRSEWRFDNLKVAVNGTEYTLDGSLFYTASPPLGTYAGEIRIINNGTLVARIYGAGVNDRRVEVLVPLAPL